MATAGEGYAEMVCSSCNVGLMYPHQELTNWKKCETCGFCKEYHRLDRVTDRMTGYEWPTLKRED